MNEKIIAYKAMKCRGKQYEVGKTYNEDKADCCHAGMHACENPLDVLHYYKVAEGARFFRVECGGYISNDSKDSKFACTELTVKSELKITDFCKIGVKAVMKRVENKIKETKEKASGWCSTGAASGDYSTGAASGWYSTAEVSGKDSIAVANGAISKARGALGCYLVLTEYGDDGKLLWAKMAQVDGDIVKEMVWYTLKNGEFVEAD
nr:MAG TPA: hypothetical protein [Caudoviricetes sp.]